jgi:hypothetical protein
MIKPPFYIVIVDYCTVQEYIQAHCLPLAIAREDFKVKWINKDTASILNPIFMTSHLKY